ncbi:hypothetical protein [Candidatus Parabeggiatoa sp. HSG14]|uniref:hypothetical protein n=1 Tax=Candidatus Parabeggiatoa sp. HSG14 TaxID=3055593 RepID=UPI0025A7437A|nr:hypothetical protein [Thiotrichales bacterium HSG14]
MFELKISCLRKAIQLSQEWATHTVSLVNPEIIKHPITLPTARKGALLQRYYFHDITKNDFLLFLKHPKLAEPKQIKDILEFTTSLQSTDKLLIHCHSGISRSTAVACGILCQHGLLPCKAIQHVLSIRPQANPNPHVLKIFDKILGFKGELVATAIKEVDKFQDEKTILSVLKDLFLFR